MWEKMWTWADVKMSRCERRCEDEQMWRWADVREDVKMSRWEKTDVREDVKMSRCERRCEDEQMWRWADVREDVKMSRCEDEKMLRRCEDEQMWRWADVREDVKMSRCLEDVKMRRCFTDPHYWKNPALRRSREKTKKIQFAKVSRTSVAARGLLEQFGVTNHGQCSQWSTVESKILDVLGIAWPIGSGINLSWLINNHQQLPEEWAKIHPEIDMDPSPGYCKHLVYISNLYWHLQPPIHFNPFGSNMNMIQVV